MVLVVSKKRIANVRNTFVLVLFAGCDPGSARTNVIAGTGSNAAAGAAGQVTAAAAYAGASAGSSSTLSAGFEATVQPFIDKACNCHQSTPELMAPFSLKHGEAYGLLVNKPAMQLPTMMLVEPGSLAKSYLWHKINGTQATVGGSGMIMPFTIPLNADEKQIFARWISAGAPQ